jgi:hypothetical protein
MLGDGHIDQTRLDVVNIRTGASKATTLILPVWPAWPTPVPAPSASAAACAPFCMVMQKASVVSPGTRSNGQFVLRLSGGGQ